MGQERSCSRRSSGWAAKASFFGAEAALLPVRGLGLAVFVQAIAQDHGGCPGGATLVHAAIAVSAVAGGAGLAADMAKAGFNRQLRLAFGALYGFSFLDIREWPC